MPIIVDVLPMFICAIDQINIRLMRIIMDILFMFTCITEHIEYQFDTYGNIILYYGNINRPEIPEEDDLIWMS